MALQRGDGKQAPMPGDSAPFILFDDARAGGKASGRLYRRPLEVIETRRPADVRPALQKLRDAERSGLHVAGFLSYEAGHALERRLAPLRSAPGAGEPPLLWFGLFDRWEEVALEVMLPDAAGAWSSEPRPMIERSDHEAAVARVKAHIEAGDIYQANLTFAAEIRTAGDPLALYAAMRGRAQAGHGGIVFTGAHWLLSFSPELFFTLDAGLITARPMKGTARRGASPETDSAAARALAADPKQRAENLMIVDLLRNDLSRVAKPGSVKVPALFSVETYPTVHQMTSTVTAEIEDGIGAVDVIEAIFPCGSITGAPKIRAMEIIAEMERARRNAYTGSIGWIAPGGKSSFNVAIRTLTMAVGENRATMGLGSAIVADSEASDEWLECLAKGEFVAGDQRRFDLFETMRFDPHEGIVDLERHLVRLKRSATELGFPFDRHSARNDLQAATFRLRGPRTIRLRISQSGAVAIEGRPVRRTPVEPVRVALRPRPVASGDFRLRYKTSDRAFYDEARTATGRLEVIFEDESGFLTEGSFTTIFVERGDKLLTPPLSRGLLPGILREKLIEEGRAEEADLKADDLADGFYLGNLVRGLLKASLVA
jgi:para-aminobenzoate synthetase/4-amino-4-deoxychorismate lyase